MKKPRTPRRKLRFQTTPLSEVLQNMQCVELSLSAFPVNLPGSVDGSVESRRPGGTTRHGGSHRQSANRQPHILVVDDERTIADTLKLILEGRGYAVTVAYDAKTALAQYDLVRPQLVLSDVVMPGMNGVEMAMQMRRRAGCPILLLSGQAMTSDLLRQAREQGHEFELLMKPIPPAELLERIALCISKGTGPAMHAGSPN